MDKQPNLLSVGLTQSIELAFNSAIRMDDMQGQGFDALDGKVIALTLSPIEQPLYCIINNRHVAVQIQINGEADSAVKTDLTSLLSLAMQSADLPFNYEVTAGDNETGNEFISALRSLDIDWEEQLSHFTGDLVAFKVGHGFRSAMQQKQQAKQYIGETLKEYLQFEINTLPPRHQVEEFIQDVDQIQTAVDELETRIKQLTAQITQTV